jgi:hypothetical protein
VSDNPTPTEHLVLEVLAARHRLGEACWTFPSSVAPAATRLAGRGLVTWKHASIEKHILIWFTEKGRAEALSTTYASPLDRVREYVEHPGNWGALDGRRRLLLALLDGEPINWKADL